MHHKLAEPFYILILFAMGAGALAGAGVAGAQHLRGRRMTLLLALSYIVVGASAGVAHLWMAPLVGVEYIDPHDAFRGAFATAVVTILIIVGRDVGFRMTVNRFGWQGRVELYRPSDEQDEKK